MMRTFGLKKPGNIANKANQSPRFARFSTVAKRAFKPCMQKQVESEISQANLKLLERLAKVAWKSGKRANGRFYLQNGKWMAELHYTSGAQRQVVKRVEQSTDGTLFVRFNAVADFITGTKEDDIKTREYIMWNREEREIRTITGESLKVGPPRTWVHFYNEARIVKATSEQEERAATILEECRKCYENYTATVLEFSETCGVKVMWTSAPEELKEKYNVSDLKTFDSWCLGWEFNSPQLYVGMKVQMRVDSVNCKGKYARKPLIRGVLLASAEAETKPVVA